MPTFAECKFKPRTISNTRITVWQERDRLHIALEDMDTDKTLIEWWDEDAQQMIEDGFLDIHEAILGRLERFVRQGGALHCSALEYWHAHH